MRAFIAKEEGNIESVLVSVATEYDCISPFNKIGKWRNAIKRLEIIRVCAVERTDDFKRFVLLQIG